jgi:methyl-accepting chemotaxis protein
LLNPVWFDDGRVLVEEKSGGSEERTRGLDQVRRAMSALEQTSQMAAAAAKENATISQ